MFVTAEDFNINPYRLKGLDDNDQFVSFVDEQEEDRLKKILGSLLYDAFIAGLYNTVDGELIAKDEGEIEERWKKLRDGSYYEYCGLPYEWKGMNKLMKPYIFSQWVKYKPEEVDASGFTLLPSSENATTISAGGAVVRAFNTFSCEVGSDYLQEDTLYGYLYNSGEMYADVVAAYYSSIQTYLADKFQHPGKMNIFNL